MLCPSHPTDTATHLLATLADGMLTFKSEPVPVSETLSEATLGLTATLRFTGPCIQAQCEHWVNRCILGEQVAAMAAPEGSQRQPCPIVERCRWRQENGEHVCGKCSTVTYLGVISTAASRGSRHH